MTNFRKTAALAVLGATVMASPMASAEVTGEIGVFSEYMFRGLDTSGGAAVQAGLEYGHGSGFYVGLWGSNEGTAPSGATSTETNLYGGWTGEFGAFGVDVGLLYYYYPEAGEVAGVSASDVSWLEGYAGATFGPLGLTFYYSDDVYASDEDGYRVEGTFNAPLTDKTEFNVLVAANGGDGIKAVFGETYLDYLVGVTVDLGHDFAASVSLVGSDLDFPGGKSDKPKFVVGLTKAFGI